MAGQSRQGFSYSEVELLLWHLNEVTQKQELLGFWGIEVHLCFMF